MGISQSSSEEVWENPAEKYDATLYYFSGRGLADQIRWMLAASNVSFTQKVINQRHQLVRMSQRQLPFGQLPLLQIDGIEIVQSQAAVRYLARRAHLEGKTPEEMLKCDMIAESVRDLLSLATSCPFKRVYPKAPAKPVAPTPAVVVAVSSSSDPVVATETASNKNTSDDSKKQSEETKIAEWEAHIKTMKDKWAFIGGRFEAILRSNVRKHQSPQSTGSAYLVGDTMTYADILVAHVTTWYVEECGADITQDMPLLVTLQNEIISLPSVKAFIKSINYFPIGDEAYVEQVRKVLNRHV